jgi:hypothetical protein
MGQHAQKAMAKVMTGRRARQMLREEMDRRFYRLGQFLGGYLHQDWPHFYGTPEKAVEKAIEEYPIELRQQVRRELLVVLSEATEDKELRKALNEGLGVNVHFKKPEEARAFAQEVEAKLMRSITEHFCEALNSRG